MSWWCSATGRNWTWTPRPYVGSIAIVAGLLALALWWVVRGRQQDPIVAARRGTADLTRIEGSSRGRTVALLLGALGLWAVLDWPLATLGAGYLATAQMVRQITMVMVVAPMLLFACPPELAVRLVGWGRRLAVLRLTARPFFAIPFAAFSLLVVNIPAVIDPLIKTPYGSFAVDALWVAAGFVLWMPVQCPHPGVRRLVGAPALMYLIAQSIVPVIPGFFMTWADFPLYSTYELAPRVVEGFDAVADQQTAAAVLQVGGMVLLWVQIAYRFLTWGYRQMDETQRQRQSMPGTGAATP